MTHLILVLGDQLSPNLSALEKATKDDVIVMAEVADETGYVPHHPKKIAFVLMAMRKFAEKLRDDGYRVWMIPTMRGPSRASCCAVPRNLAPTGSSPLNPVNGG